MWHRVLLVVHKVLLHHSNLTKPALTTDQGDQLQVDTGKSKRVIRPLSSASPKINSYQ